MYETMVFWETGGDDDDVTRDFAAQWRAADKVVYSRTLNKPSSARTRIEPHFDPAAVRDLKASSAKDLSVGGPHLAAEALQGGLVDELQLILVPVVVGSGNRALPDLELRLSLLEHRRFASGNVFLRYGVDR
jgi:dihydrofolate reductase